MIAASYSSGISWESLHGIHCLVDILNRPDLSGSWEEIWRSVESIEYLDIDSLYEYLNLFHNQLQSTTIIYF
jgi:hypothetical protein